MALDSELCKTKWLIIGGSDSLANVKVKLDDVIIADKREIIISNNALIDY